MSDDEQLIREQIAYYRHRAPEYDETSRPPGDPFASYGRELEAALADFAPRGRVLEIACGTGWWTKQLLKYASDVTALDSSPEMLALTAERVGGDPRVHYVEANVFAWKPDASYDVVFCANWLSHVPPTRFDEFWRVVREALVPEGRAFFIEEGQDAWRHEEPLEESGVPLVRRTLGDGTSYRVVKIYWDVRELQRRLTDLGWDIDIHTTGPFLWGHGRPAAERPS